MRVKIVKFCKIARNLWAAIFGLLSIGLTFVSWENLEIFDTCLKLKILLFIIVFIAVCSSLLTIFSRRETVWKRGDSQVSVKYGDIHSRSTSTQAWGRFTE